MAKQKSDRTTGPKREKAPQKRREVTEAKIIAAAVTLFAKSGYDGTTTKEIAQKAKANESLIIRYFDGKEGLLIECIRRFFEDKARQPLPYPAQGTLEDEIVRHVEVIIADMESNDSFFKILFGRSTVDGKLRKRINDMLPSKGNPQLRKRLSDLRAQGLIPKSVDDELLVMIPFQSLSMMYLATGVLNRTFADMTPPTIALVRATVRGLFKN